MTMTLFNATAVTALQKSNDNYSLGLYSYYTEAQFEIKRVGKQAPALML